jgi:sulfite reductase (NADPH) hemoprotein beta-component
MDCDYYLSPRQHERSDPMKLESLTANRLSDGAVVWLSDAGSWSDSVANAAMYGAEDLPDALGRAAEAEARQEIVASYAIEMQLIDGKPVPVAYKELIRALGPSVRTDLGKQAEQRTAIAPVIAAAGAH